MNKFLKIYFYHGESSSSRLNQPARIEQGASFEAKKTALLKKIFEDAGARFPAWVDICFGRLVNNKNKCLELLNASLPLDREPPNNEIDIQVVFNLPEEGAKSVFEEFLETTTIGTIKRTENSKKPVRSFSLQEFLGLFGINNQRHFLASKHRMLGELIRKGGVKVNLTEEAFAKSIDQLIRDKGITIPQAPQPLGVDMFYHRFRAEVINKSNIMDAGNYPSNDQKMKKFIICIKDFVEKHLRSNPYNKETLRDLIVSCLEKYSSASQRIGGNILHTYSAVECFFNPTLISTFTSNSKYKKVFIENLVLLNDSLNDIILTDGDTTEIVDMFRKEFENAVKVFNTKEGNERGPRGGLFDKLFGRKD